MIKWSQLSRLKKIGAGLGAIVGLFVCCIIILVGLNIYLTKQRAGDSLAQRVHYPGASGVISGDDLGLEYATATGLANDEASPIIELLDNISTKATLEETATPNTQVLGAQPAYAQEGELTQKKIIRDGSLSLFVISPEDSIQKISDLATSAGGFIQNSQIYEVSNGNKSGYIVIRVPATKFGETVSKIKELAKEVEREEIESKDVTERFVDLEARLHNYQAEEARYLEIMNKAVTIDETLKVSRQLSAVREKIETLQGQLQYLSRQVEMSTISVNLTSYDDVKVFGLRWRPLYQIKKSFRGLLDGLTGYIDAMIGLLMSLPIIILWLATILVIAILVWKILRWVYRRFIKRQAPPVQ
ncbi:MAG: DUF4349 domain-containing protein [Patescibacteria group bacterium]